jgi:hypothetical protein
MKCRVLLSVAALILSGFAAELCAQDALGAGCRGFGYGGPPKTEQERAARQAACLERNGGVCPSGGPRANCPAGRQGQGKGAGKGWGRGLRDGTGPRAANGTCPLAAQQPASK